VGEPAGDEHRQPLRRAVRLTVRRRAPGRAGDAPAADADDLADEVGPRPPRPAEPLAALLLDALTSLISSRDLRVVLLFAVQQSQGDPSPSHTVAGTTGLKPDNVRQIVSRTRRRLHDLVERDPRFGDLAALPFLGLAEAA
jgi:hypothetical protein